MKKRAVITEADVLAADRAGRRVVITAGSPVITPLARDVARAKGITFQSGAAEPAPESESNSNAAYPTMPPILAIGCDHGGFLLKQELSPHITSLGWALLDVGTNSDAKCDYPDYAYAVALAVASGSASLGLMIDGAGPGSAIVCNKVPGIRAVAASGEFLAWNARAHNDCNVLTLGSRVTGLEVCKRIVATFLDTAFEGGRHQGRVDKILDVERRFATDE